MRRATTRRRTVRSVTAVTDSGLEPETPPTESRRAWATLWITSVSMFLVSMDVTIVSVALPDISRDFSDTSSATLSWVFTAYNVTFAALLLLAGKLGDRWGRKRAFQIGLVHVPRRVDAGRAAPRRPASSSAPARSRPPGARSSTRRRWRCCCSSSRSTGGPWPSACGAASPGSGPPSARRSAPSSSSAAGWRSVFFINVPFVTAALVAGVVFLRESKGANPHERFDPIAVPLAAVAVGLLVLGVVEGGPWGWSSPQVIACFLGFAVLFPASCGARPTTLAPSSTSTCSGCAASAPVAAPRRCTSGPSSAGSC